MLQGCSVYETNGCKLLEIVIASEARQECYRDVAFTEPRDVIFGMLAIIRLIVSHAYAFTAL